MKRILISLLIILLVTACQSQPLQTPSETTETQTEVVDKRLHLIKNNDPPKLHPWYATDEHSILVLGNTDSGLFNLDNQRVATEDLARTTHVSDDGLRYTFELKKGQFVNSVGEQVAPIIASDFVYSWKKLADPRINSPYRSLIVTAGIKGSTKLNDTQALLDSYDQLVQEVEKLPETSETMEVVQALETVEEKILKQYASVEEARIAIPQLVEDLSITAESDMTLVVELERPVPFFKELLCFPSFAPVNQAFYEKQGDNYGASAEQGLYTGAYYLSDWQSLKSYQLTKNDQYWAAYQVALEGIDVTIDPDNNPQKEVEAYLNGEIDWTYLTGENIEKYGNRPDTWYRLEASIVYVEVNEATTSDKYRAFLANPLTRKALNQSLDKQRLSEEVLNNGSVATDAFYPKSFQQFEGRDIRLLDQKYNDGYNPFDLETAQKQWDEARAEADLDWARLELLSSDNDTSVRVAQFLKQEWEKALPNLTIDIKIVPFGEKLQLVDEGNYQLSVSGWAPDYPDILTFAELWHSHSPHNATGYSNSEYDQLIDRAVTGRLTKPGQELDRLISLLEAERILLQQDQVIIPLYQRGTIDLLNPAVRNLTVQIIGPQFQFKYVDID